MSRTQGFQVEGMTCGHCQAAVAKALTGLAGVRSATVDLARNEAIVTYDDEAVTQEQLFDAVTDAGYVMKSA